jgi:methanogenic corrinoid protein MtbC1
MVSREIIPRLGQQSLNKAAHMATLPAAARPRDSRAAPNRGAETSVSVADEAARAETAALTARIAQRAIVGDRAACERIIAQETDRGRSLESIMLDLLQGAARHLGIRWEDDTLNFTDVALGVWTLDQIVADIVAEFLATGERPLVAAAKPAMKTAPPVKAAYTALFCTLPGSQHRFGIQMLGAFFTGAGWSATIADAGDEHSLLAQLTQSSTQIIGLSVASESELHRAAALISRMRAQFGPASGPHIMIGGPATIAFPDIARSVGADAVSDDAADALRLATRLIEHGAQ